jgi:hypothetical protein
MKESVRVTIDTNEQKCIAATLRFISLRTCAIAITLSHGHFGGNDVVDIAFRILFWNKKKLSGCGEDCLTYMLLSFLVYLVNFAKKNTLPPSHA